MINTPIKYCPISEAVFDADGLCIAKDIYPDDGIEIVKRVNLHNELVGCLMLARDMFVANDLILPKTLETINKCLEKCK